jgi:hypothetical protein
VVDYGISPNNWNPSRITPYFGIHLNFRYVNPDYPLSQLPDKPFDKYIARRLSAFVGITLFSVAQPGEIDNLFNKNALLLGLGYKLTNAWRIVLGSMFVKQVNPNPVITSTKGALLPFVGTSFDMSAVFTSIVSLLK